MGNQMYHMQQLQGGLRHFKVENRQLKMNLDQEGHGQLLQKKTLKRFVILLNKMQDIQCLT